RPVGEVCPVEWARMPNRSVLQWDKDDCAYAGLVKFDLLGLGMLTALRDCFELVAEHHGVRWDLHSIPQEDAGVYDMLCEADTVGAFRVESGAQMATLRGLRPRGLYDHGGGVPGRGGGPGGDAAAAAPGGVRRRRREGRADPA